MIRPSLGLITLLALLVAIGLELWPDVYGFTAVYRLLDAVLGVFHALQQLLASVPRNWAIGAIVSILVVWFVTRPRRYPW